MADKAAANSVCFASNLISRRSLIQRECKDGQWRFEYDGCTPPDWAPEAFKKIKDNPARGRDTHFAKRLPSTKGGKACDRHDECYQTCYPSSRAKQAKQDCDDRMNRDMIEICNRSEEKKDVKKMCSDAAGVYYSALAFAGSIFDDRQKEVCSCASPPSKQKK
jgi:hypothetical protein